MRSLHRIRRLAPFSLCCAPLFALGQAVPDGPKEPVSLEYSVVTEDLRNQEYLDGALATRRALMTNAIKQGKVKMTPEELEEDIAKSRKRFEQRSRKAVSEKVVVACDGKTIRIEETNEAGVQVILIGNDSAFIKRSTGEGELQSRQELSQVGTLPFVGRSIGPLELLKAATTGDPVNPEGAPYLLLMPSTAHSLTYIPTWLATSKTGSAQLKSGLRDYPRQEMVLLATKDTEAGPVCSHSETTLRTTNQDLARSGLEGIPTKEFDISKVTATLTKVGEPLPNAQFLPSSLLKKGDRVSVDDLGAFYYDPDGGSLMEQAHKNRKELDREKDLEKSLKQQPSGLAPAIGGLAAILGLVTWWLINKRRKIS